jgi:hypothetical protein
MSISTGVFETRADAERAMAQFEAAGINENQISLVMTEDTRNRFFGLKKSSKADEGVATGASVGGLLGAIAGVVLSAGALAIPGLNIVVTGAIVSGLAGLGAGAVSGGLVGGLIGSGIPEHEAKLYEDQIKGGKVLVAVKTETSEQKKIVDDIFDRVEKQRTAA